MKTRRRGYTLFQLLVLLAFLLILMAMLFPATLQVRAAAARMQSQNNLKQLALALHNYHDVHNSFPAGVDGRGYSGLTHILPYLEQDHLYKKTDLTKSPDDAGHAEIRASRVKTYESPLDETDRPSEKAGPTSYFLVAGTQYPLANNDGVFFRESKLNFLAIADGTSNTIFTLESLRGDGEKKAVTVQRQHVLLKKEDIGGVGPADGIKEFENNKGVVGERGASWMEGRFLQATINVTRELNDKNPDVDCGGAGGLAAPRSLQPGTNVGMADGSVRFVSKSVSFKTWKDVATRAGGEVLGPDW